MKKRTKLLSSMLSMALVVGLMPLPACADDATTACAQTGEAALEAAAGEEANGLPVQETDASGEREPSQDIVAGEETKSDAASDATQDDAESGKAENGDADDAAGTSDAAGNVAGNETADDAASQTSDAAADPACSTEGVEGGIAQSSEPETDLGLATSEACDLSERVIASIATFAETIEDLKAQANSETIQTLTPEGSGTMLVPSAAQLVTVDGTTTLSITFSGGKSNRTYMKCYLGTTDQAAGATSTLGVTDNTVVGIPESYCKGKFAPISAMYQKKDGTFSWIDAAIKIDGDKLYYGKIADTMITLVDAPEGPGMLKVVSAERVAGMSESTLSVTFGPATRTFFRFFLGTKDEAEKIGDNAGTEITGEHTATGIPLSYCTNKYAPIAAQYRNTKTGELRWIDGALKLDGSKLYFGSTKNITAENPDPDPDPDPDQPASQSVSLAPSRPSSGQVGYIMLNIGSAVLNKGANPTLDIQFSTDVKAYYRGTAEQQAAAGSSTSLSNKKITGLPASDFLKGYAPIAVQYTRSGNWKTVALKIDEKGKILYFGSDELLPSDTGSGKSDKPAAKPKPSPSSTDNAPGATVGNTSVTLADGEYTPDSFSWSGGSGRLKGMSCSKIIVRGGKAYAVIVINSGSYAYVMANGATVPNSTPGTGVSTFEIPIELNKNNVISGMTTAMSASHWVNYSIFVGLKAAANGDAVATNIVASDALDEEAPEIAGLKFESETEFKNAKNVKIFNYEGGYRLIEINISKSGKWNGQNVDSFTDMLKQVAEAGMKDAEGVEEGDASASEFSASAYIAGVVKYLIVPKGKEAPAGIEETVVVVEQPIEGAHVASRNALKMLVELDVLDSVSTVELSEADLEGDEFAPVREAIADDRIKRVDPDPSVDYAALVKQKCGLYIAPSSVLAGADEDATPAEQTENYIELAKRFGTLDIPFVLDCSDSEDEDEAQAEWILLYGALFDVEDEAAEIYEQAYGHIA